MTELANPGWGALAALLVLIWRMEAMSNATQRLDASVARIAQDVSDIVERIRDNAGVDEAAVLADCDRLDLLSEALEGLGGPADGQDASPDTPQESPVPADGQQG